jgi:hypothetical protein
MAKKEHTYKENLGNQTKPFPFVNVFFTLYNIQSNRLVTRFKRLKIFA